MPAICLQNLVCPWPDLRNQICICVHVMVLPLSSIGSCADRQGWPWLTMASWLSRGHTTWLSLSRMLQLNLKQPGHCTTLASPTPFFRSFAAVGRPRKAAAAPKAAKAAAATATEKKPASAYALYVKQAFPKTKSSNPSAPFADISKQVSAQWKGLDQSQKSE